MARTVDWRKEWVQGATGDSGESGASIGKENVGGRMNTVLGEDSGNGGTKITTHRRQSSASFVSAAQANVGDTEVDVADDESDQMSSVSTPGLRITGENGLHSGARYAATVSAAIVRQNVESVFADIIEWLSETVHGVVSREEISANDLAKEPLGSLASARLYKIVDDGEALVGLLVKSKLVSSSDSLLKALPKSAGPERTEACFKLFTKCCLDLGLPQQFIIVQQDRNNKRIAGCFILLSRCCRASNQRDVRRLSVNQKSLSAIDLRAEDIVVSKPHPLLQEAQLKGAFWVPDTFSNSCMLCERPFTWLGGRHHCRSCGILCCSGCSPARERCLGYAPDSKQRICVSCAKQRLVGVEPLVP